MSGRKHYAWVICAVGLWISLCNMGLCSNILTIYLPFIEKTGISDSMGSAIISVRCLFSFLSMFIVDYLYWKLSLRKGIFLASLIGAAAPLVFFIGGAPAYFCGAAMAGIAYGAGCIYPVSLLITNWFSTHRGLALGVSSAGSGVATMLILPMISSVILNHSLRTAFLVHAGILFSSAVVIFFLVRDTPAEKGLQPYGQAVDQTKRTDPKEAPALPKKLLWILAVMMLINGGIGLAFSGHLSVLTIHAGYSPETAASVISIFGLVLIFSKSMAGAMADRFGTRRSSMLLILTFIAGCFFVLPMDGIRTLWCYLLVILVGFGASVFNVGPPLWAQDLDPAHYAKTLRWLQLFYNLGGVALSSLPGIIAEFTGEYASSYLLFAALMAVSLFILLWVYCFVGKKLRPAA